jgi:hypothetical protein
MTDPERTHPEQPAEGADADESATSGRTPHPEQPAEGEDVGGGESADTPS